MILVAAAAVLLQAAIKKVLPHRLETASAGSVVLLFLALGVILGRIGSQVCTICRCIGGSIRGILCRGFRGRLRGGHRVFRRQKARLNGAVRLLVRNIQRTAVTACQAIATGI